MPFALGQRWISDTETDLGLGTVVAVEGRMVTLLFPATGENRMYAKEEAPVTRVSFNVGDQITSHEDWTMTVEEVQEKNGLLIYVGVRTDNDEPVALKEVFLNNFIKFNKPQDRLFAGQIDRMSRFTLRYEALVNQHQRRRNPTRGLAGGRVSLIPHQLYIAHEVGHRYAPRVLLADEVGLGKTIEAGMIIHQQLLSGRAHRVLILLPETLQHQWLVEMLRRFNLHFSLFDEERCIEAFADAENPFETEQLVICSLDFLRKKRRRFEQVLEAEWDLLVVDEAHHLEWSEEAPSRAYEMVEALAEQVPGVLLLTATPDQLGHQSHFARLRLLDPERFYDYEAFLAEEQAYGQVASAAQELLEGETLSDEARQILASQLEGLDLSDAAARQQAVAKLLDQHGTGRVLFRNSRANIQGFPERHLNIYPMPLPDQYKTAIKVMGMMGGNGGDLQTRALRYLYPEKIFQQFEGDNATWTQFDPRVEWLLGLLLSARQQKVLVICSEAATALALEEALRTREGSAAPYSMKGCPSSSGTRPRPILRKRMVAPRCCSAPRSVQKVATSSLPVIWCCSICRSIRICWNSVSVDWIVSVSRIPSKSTCPTWKGPPSAPCSSGITMVWMHSSRPARLPARYSKRCVTSCSSCWPPTQAIRPPRRPAGQNPRTARAAQGPAGTGSRSPAGAPLQRWRRCPAAGRQAGRRR